MNETITKSGLFIPVELCRVSDVEAKAKARLADTIAALARAEAKAESYRREAHAHRAYIAAHCPERWVHTGSCGPEHGIPCSAIACTSRKYQSINEQAEGIHNQ